MGVGILKRYIVIVVILTLICSKSSNAGRFTDVPNGAWYGPDLEYVTNYDHRIISGYPDGTFKPEGTLTVDQFLKCLVVASGHTVIHSGDGYWAQPYIDEALETGIISQGDFSDYRVGLSREVMAGIVLNAVMQLEYVKLRYSSEIELSLTDRSLVNPNHMDDVTAVFELGIITGYPDGRFAPMATLTRAEAVTIIRRIIDVSARVPFSSEEKIDYDEHLMGGEEWVDPSMATPEMNRKEDQMMIKSDNLYYENHSDDVYKDSITMIVFYPESGIPEEQLEDVQRILSRRLDHVRVESIMNYFEGKEGWYTTLNEPIRTASINPYSFFMKEITVDEDTNRERSEAVMIQMWY